jgi:7-cyano-7-deazaguanine synthase
MHQAVVLLSGGMDSATLLHAVCRRRGMRRVCALSFDYGQKHARELSMARRQARAAGVREHRVLDCRFLGALVAGGSALTDDAIPVPDLADLAATQEDQPPTYVPNRNMILLALSSAFAEAQGIADVFYGAHRQDRYGYWDCTPEFVSRLNGALALNRRNPIRIHAPFARMLKADIVRLGIELGVDFARTWSCYRGGRRPCGACPTCVERAGAFRAADVIDPLVA